MNWQDLPSFLEMGGYALYVWGSYLMLAGALVWEVALLLQRRRGALDEARQFALLDGGSDRHDAAA